MKEVFEKIKQAAANAWRWIVRKARERWEHRKLHLRMTYHELKWTKFDSYIMKNFLPAVFGSMLLFISIYELTQIFTELKWLPPDVNTLLLVKRYLYDMVYWTFILQPFSFLFASVFVLSKMINTREIMAAISTGTSIYRVTLYMVAFAVLYYIISVFFIVDKIICPMYQKSQIYKEVVFKRATLDQLDRLKDNRNFSIFGSNNLLYIVGYYNAVTKEMENVTIVQFFDKAELAHQLQSGVSTNDPYRWLATNIQNIDRERLLAGNYDINFKLRLDAQKARWDSTASNWIFQNGKIRYMLSDNVSMPEQDFVSASFQFIKDPPDYFEKMWYNVDAMTIKESIRYIKRLKLAHQEWKGEQARLLSKFSYPIGIIFVVLIGVGIANITNRKSTFVINLVISLALFLTYYVFFATGLALSGKGVMSPFAGAFMGSIVFTVLGVILYARAKT